MTVRQLAIDAIGQMEHACAAARDAALRPGAEERCHLVLARMALELDAARQRLDDLAGIVRAAARREASGE